MRLAATLRHRVPAFVALLAISCVPEPIAWEPTRDAREAIHPGTRLAFDATGSPRFVDDTVPQVPLPPTACSSSLVAADAGREWYAVWFTDRADGGVTLVVSRSADGGATWLPPVIADARDRGTRGCDRPPPSIAADSASGYVHVAYYLEPPEGAGVWYTHSMERGTIWHQTIGVLYGEEPAHTSVASAGDTVVVAYEHPGSGGRRLGLAISRQTGHTFDERLRVVRANGTVRDPRVAVAGDRVALAWREGSAATDSAGAMRTRLRTGAFR
ncbi:MAG: hypothetical protein ACT4PJ_11385 [Gemmatimonadaceae bacterium]